MSCLDHRARWTWEEGVRGEDGEWIKKPSLVLNKAISTRRRFRRHSLASSVGSGSTTILGSAYQGSTHFRGSISRLEGGKVDEERSITLEDIKAVAVKNISTGLLQKMKRSTAVLFDEFYRSETMNVFLWSVLLYYDAFCSYREASSDDNITVPGAPGKDARKTLRIAEKELAQAGVNLGEQYSRLNTGQSHPGLHHSGQGCLRASQSNRDQHLYEVIYEFAMFVTWITFGYKDWGVIHRELGRIFKTQAFNRDLRVKGEATVEFIEELGCKMDRKSDEYLSYRAFYDRPPQGSLKELRSPALKAYFPSPKEKHSWAFEPPYHPTRQNQSLMATNIEIPEKLGIIGETMSKVNPDDLKYREEEEEEEEEDELLEDEEAAEEDELTILDSKSLITVDTDNDD